MQPLTTSNWSLFRKALFRFFFIDWNLYGNNEICWHACCAQNTLKAKEIIDSNLFRPPYGAITRFQAKLLSSFYKIIMWNVLSADFDTSISHKKCLENVIENTKEGSIIVFHDSEKALPHLQYALPKALDFFAEKGYKMEKIK